MILGREFFVTPSDSVAIIAANAQNVIPYFQSGPKVRSLCNISFRFVLYLIKIICAVKSVGFSEIHANKWCS